MGGRIRLVGDTACDLPMLLIAGCVQVRGCVGFIRDKASRTAQREKSQAQSHHRAIH